jgi:hypothetical protein
MNDDDEIVSTSPASEIVIRTFDGEHIETIQLAEVSITRVEARATAPEWLALHDAEQADATTGSV